MKSEDYAWNTHERKCYENDQVFLPSPYKLKILDDSEKRLELELVLEELPQEQLARWAMKMASSFIALIDAEDESEKQKILTQVREVFQARLDGRASAYELRQAGFLANKLSQQANHKSVNMLRVFLPKESQQATCGAMLLSQRIMPSKSEICRVQMICSGLSRKEKDR